MPLVFQCALSSPRAAEVTAVWRPNRQPRRLVHQVLSEERNRTVNHQWLSQRMFCASLAVLLLAGCGGTQAVPTAIPIHVPPTPTPLPPTPTSAPVPLTPTSILLATGTDESEVEITYICNEGFLITSASGKKVLVDALFVGLPGYGIIPPEQLTLMKKALPPFDEIDLILTTHDHEDHFDADVVLSHLKNDPQAVFVSTEQAVDHLRVLSGFDEVQDRVRAIRLGEGERTQLTLNGIGLEIVYLRHVHNLGFLVTVDGKRLFHMGDSSMSLDQIQEVYQLAKEEIDVAFVPDWYSAETIKAELGAKHVILMHAPYHKPMQKWIVR